MDSACDDVVVDSVLHPRPFPMGFCRLQCCVVDEIGSQKAVSADASLPVQVGRATEWVVFLARTTPELVEVELGPVGAFVAPPNASLFTAFAAFIGDLLSSMYGHAAIAA